MSKITNQTKEGMSRATLIQLAARGKQDAELTGQPQMTYFQSVWRQHTPFAIESIPIDFDGTPDFGKRISCLIPRKADLLSSLFLEVDLPALSPVDGTPIYWCNDIGHALIENVSIEIGDKEIDKHTGEWLQVWSELITPADKRDGFSQMVGHWDVYPDTTYSAATQRLTIPLRFWFCNGLGAALPLIALQAHPVRLIVHLRRFQDLWWSVDKMDPATQCNNIPPVSITRLQLYGDYVFLDRQERQVFATKKHQYLITQLQYTPRQSVPAGSSIVNVPLVFNNLCKEFIWVVQQDRMRDAREWFNYSNLLTSNGGEVGTTQDLMDTAIIQLDGMDRFYRRFAPYFRTTQPYQYHTTIPNSFIYLYSFAAKPEDDVQPSGGLSCSKIDDINLNMTFNPNTLQNQRSVMVYTRNWNILTIVGGLGGVEYIA